MLTRLPPGLPVYPDFGNGTPAQRLAKLEQEHYRLLEAMQGMWDTLNRDGALDIVQARITASHGVIFPATQNSSTDVNTLDDYEEGSATPTVTAGSGTFTTVSGAVRSTKIGDRVCYSVTVTITTNGSAATTVLVPMPFAAAELTASNGTRTSDATALSGYVSGSTLTIVKYDGTYPGGSGITLVMSGSYRV